MRRFSASVAALFFLIVVLEGVASSNDSDVAVETTVEQGLSTELWLQGEFNGAFVGEWVSKSRFMGSPAYGARFGLRINNWDVFLHVEHGFWGRGTGSGRSDEQILNLGAGTGYKYFNGNIRSSITIGPAILLTRSIMDEPGTTGFYMETRPASFRWTVGRVVSVEFSPLFFSFVAPVTEGVPLVHITYRTALSVEFGL